MKRVSISPLLLIPLGVLLLAGVSEAQSSRRAPPSRGRSSLGATNRPAFSPYLNLLRTNSGPVQNYYGLVKPQQQFQSANEELDSNFKSLKRDVDGVRDETDQSSRLRQSGHTARFMTDLHGGLGTSMDARNDFAKSDAQSKYTGSRLAPSGHAVTFGNTGSYYPSRQR